MARLVTLVVEDGNIVAGANSFVTETQIVAHALARGITIPSGNDADLDAVAVLGIQAMDYLRALPWKGEVVDEDQTTPWPRKNTGYAYPDNRIPSVVIEAQLQLAMQAQQGVILTGGGSISGMVLREKLGPIETEYSEKYGFNKNGLPYFPWLDGLLGKWLVAEPEEGVVYPMVLNLGDCQ